MCVCVCVGWGGVIYPLTLTHSHTLCVSTDLGDKVALVWV